MSFAGLVFQNGERVARVRITSGNLAPGAAAQDSGDEDVVVVDDLLYSEPQSLLPSFSSAARLPDGTFTAGVEALPGLRYSIERNPAIDQPGWSFLTGAAGPVTFIDPGAVGQPRMFYRAVLAPLP